MRVTTKGQVTIPKEIRDRLGIEPGSEVEFVERADGAVELVSATEPDMLSRAIDRSFEDWLQRVEGTGDSNLTADDIMAMTRDRDVGDSH
ncbi:AbrB/MazE/SpoVT family DNA-binding domain-containing protein [Aminobacter anthyllidis]|uniref:AbrB/MazE/SpoVT family DNA-binding domain-containing protein n=1 Tax=Aminobacter anthyllidis TaxID=1035067 RepID=UPI00245739A2|nr:AbrB/MazE/SpoVT family DNA-binding domain-containing protein [Aminobacter anthyllidis]MDH4987623.1 AbrB/MazE/SpoVT family DNA-binding domain-containing protein [Aminobacter anthyllidis]